MTDLLTLRVRALTWEADGILGIELVPVDAGATLPPADAGAHILLHPPAEAGVPPRSYSITHPDDTRAWRIAVNLDAASRGGSRWLHQHLRPGMLLRAEPPKNLFPLDEAAPLSVLIAGGIGITPLISMARRLNALQRPWALHQAARSRAHAPFVGELRALAAAGQGTLHLHLDDEAGRVLDVAAIIATLPPGAHVYACGPKPMLAAFDAATAGLPPKRVHQESFTGVDAAALAAERSGFMVKLHRSGRRIAVTPGQTILAALQAAGCDPLYSCGEGICGTCQVRVVAGVPEHRDLVQSDAEKASNTQIMICCSGSTTPELELDL